MKIEVGPHPYGFNIWNNRDWFVYFGRVEYRKRLCDREPSLFPKAHWISVQ